MKSTVNIQVLLIEDLGKSIEQKIILLKCLNVMYTSSLDLFEKESYDEFFEKLDQQQIIENSLDGIELQIQSLAARFENKSEIEALLIGSKEVSTYPLYLIKIAENVIISRKLLKNCKTLNEKLTYRVNEVQNEIKQKMVSSKNRRIIRAGYDSYNPSKVGLSIDC